MYACKYKIKIISVHRSLENQIMSLQWLLEYSFILKQSRGTYLSVGNAN
jgi:hypothetical protein